MRLLGSGSRISMANSPNLCELAPLALVLIGSKRGGGTCKGTIVGGVLSRMYRSVE